MEHDATVAGSASLRDKGQRVDAKIVEVALYFQQEMLGAGQEAPAAPPGQQAALLEQVPGQGQGRPCVPGQQELPAEQELPSVPGSPMQQAAVLAPPAQQQQQAGLSESLKAGQEPNVLPLPDAAAHGQGLAAGKNRPTTPPAESPQQAASPEQELGAGQAPLPDQPTARPGQGHLEYGHLETGPEVAESSSASNQPAVGLAGSQAPALAGSAAAAAAAEQGLSGWGDKTIGDEGSEGNTASFHSFVDSTTQHGTSHSQTSQPPDGTPMANSGAGLQAALATDAEAAAEADSEAEVSAERGPSQSQQKRLGPDSAAAAGAGSHAGGKQALQSASSSLQQQQSLGMNSISRVALGGSPLQAGGLLQQQESEAGQPGPGSDAASQLAQPLQVASRAGQQAGALLPNAGSSQQPSGPVAHQAAAAQQAGTHCQEAAAPNGAVEGAPPQGSPAPVHGSQAAQGADEKQWPVLLLSNDNAQLQLAKSHGCAGGLIACCLVAGRMCVCVLPHQHHA